MPWVTKRIGPKLVPADVRGEINMRFALSGVMALSSLPGRQTFTQFPIRLTPCQRLTRTALDHNRPLHPSLKPPTCESTRSSTPALAATGGRRRSLPIWCTAPTSATAEGADDQENAMHTSKDKADEETDPGTDEVATTATGGTTTPAEPPGSAGAMPDD
ncbi:unnamed protein product, partial [Ascophyllum nodosum]